MERVPHERIISDSKYRADIERAKAKAQAACDKISERLEREEQKLLRKLATIDEARRGLFRETYRPIFDPLEEAAYANAEKRLSKA